MQIATKVVAMINRSNLDLTKILNFNAFMNVSLLPPTFEINHAHTDPKWPCNGFLKPIAQDIHPITFDVDPDGEGDVVLSDGGEEGAEVDEPVDAVRHHDLLQVLEVEDVREDERT